MLMDFPENAIFYFYLVISFLCPCCIVRFFLSYEWCVYILGCVKAGGVSGMLGGGTGSWLLIRAKTVDQGRTDDVYSSSSSMAQYGPWILLVHPAITRRFPLAVPTS